MTQPTIDELLRYTITKHAIATDSHMEQIHVGDQYLEHISTALRELKRLREVRARVEGGSDGYYRAWFAGWIVGGRHYRKQHAQYVANAINATLDGRVAKQQGNDNDTD